MTLWSRWQRFAHRAAVVQSNVLLFLMYFVLVVPAAAVMRLKPSRNPETPGWHPVTTAADSVRSAHEQF
jgi:hypothetical protein